MIAIPILPRLLASPVLRAEPLGGASRISVSWRLPRRCFGRQLGGSCDSRCRCPQRAFIALSKGLRRTCLLIKNCCDAQYFVLPLQAHWNFTGGCWRYMARNMTVVVDLPRPTGRIVPVDFRCISLDCPVCNCIGCKPMALNPQCLLRRSDAKQERFSISMPRRNQVGSLHFFHS
jgi:hypothetical protein